MSKYIIIGGKPLSGEVSVRGAKNASFKQIIATLLTNKLCTLTNIPQISDIKITQSIAKHLGSKIEKFGEHGIKIHTPKITNSAIPSGTGSKSRTSFMFIPPVLIRTGQITFPTPGGDKLGTRPLDRLFNCLSLMGISIKHQNDSTTLKSNKIFATEYTLLQPSHTVTEVIIMLASLADGKSVFHNTAQEPEIDDLILMLNKMGAKIKRDTKTPSTVYINGVNSLKGINHQTISDRNEAVTFICAALSTKGQIDILRIDPNIIRTFLNVIKQMGASVICGKDEVSVKWTKALKAINIETEPEPGFMTDWQAVFSVVLTQTTGCNSIVERIFPQRFQHIEILNKMGAKTKFFNPKIDNPKSYYHFNPENDHPSFYHGVKIYGPCKLQPANITINDLRAGATATLAALTADGQSVINNIEYIKRGYENLADRLRSLGANIKYIKS
ncbi:UDP-N-acetylglucosamine 1-carboxyvinyltransferase [Patescibacteria group bacterium]|nr:UDP-N-acetylglucosamine 1-carboxyvinyltransferase [Patescibacteria group bacterium]